MTTAPSPLPHPWFGPSPVLLPDERSIAHHAANRAQGKRAVGGGLHVTTQRLLFCPNLIDARMGGKSWECRLPEIASVGLQPRRLALTELFSGGLSNRLRIDLRNGSHELFVIGAIEKRIAELRTVLGFSDDDGPSPAPLPEMRVSKRT